MDPGGIVRPPNPAGPGNGLLLRFLSSLGGVPAQGPQGCEPPARLRSRGACELCQPRAWVAITSSASGLLSASFMSSSSESPLTTMPSALIPSRSCGTITSGRRGNRQCRLTPCPRHALRDMHRRSSTTLACGKDRLVKESASTGSARWIAAHPYVVQYGPGHWR